MVKRYFLIFSFLVINAVTFNVSADPNDVPMTIIKEGGAGLTYPKIPARPWYITLDGNVFTLSATTVDYELQLIDEMGNLVYSEFLPAGTTQIVLPTNLTGEFEIRLVADTYYYRGYLLLE